MFEWDDANVDHIARHDVRPEEAEDALTDPLRIGAPAYAAEGERRWAILGATIAGSRVVRRGHDTSGEASGCSRA